MEKVFVTGVSGFIGSYIAEKLINNGYQVAALLRHTNRLNYPSVQRLLNRMTFYYGSLTDFAAVRWGISNFKPDYIIHLGAITPVAYSFDHPHEVTETNYIGTINMAESAKKECPNLKKFIFASSVEVYGYQDKREPFVEADEPKPACPYAVAKVACEKYLQYLNYAYGFPSVMLRQTNTYGRKENDYFVIEAIVTQMLKSNVVNLGNPEPVRGFLFIDDLTDLYLTLIRSNSDKLFGHIFNTGPPNGMKIGDLTKKIASKLDWHGKIDWYTRPPRPGEIFYLNCSNEKLTKAIDWKPKISLDEGLDRVIEIWKENFKLN